MYFYWFDSKQYKKYCKHLLEFFQPEILFKLDLKLLCSRHCTRPSWLSHKRDCKAHQTAAPKWCLNSVLYSDIVNQSSQKQCLSYQSGCKCQFCNEKTHHTPLFYFGERCFFFFSRKRNLQFWVSWLPSVTGSIHKFISQLSGSSRHAELLL